MPTAGMDLLQSLALCMNATTRVEAVAALKTIVFEE